MPRVASNNAKVSGKVAECSSPWQGTENSYCYVGLQVLILQENCQISITEFQSFAKRN